MALAKRPSACMGWRRSWLAEACGDGLTAIVSDVRLARGEDGIDAVARVQSRLGRSLPTVLITGGTALADVRTAHGSGHKVLFKPVQPRDLVAALRSLATPS